MSKRLTRVYSCGGAAINITAQTKDHKDSLGFADLAISRIDTSDKNIKPGMDPNSVYVLEDADGSGKQRAHNYNAIVASLDQMLSKHKPGDYNIVVFSAGGGSGSVIGPVIVGELLRRQLPVVAIVIGTSASETETNNSIKTLKSLAGVAQTQQAPVVMSYWPVNQHYDQSDVNRKVGATISLLLNLFDSKNIEIDYKDIINFLRYTNVRSSQPGLVSLDLFNDQELQEIAGTSPLAMATIFKDEARPYLPVIPDYPATGTRDQNVTDERMQFTAHYVITSQPVKAAFDELNTRLKQITDQQHARGNNYNLLGEGDSTDGNGMVL